MHLKVKHHLTLGPEDPAATAAAVVTAVNPWDLRPTAAYLWTALDGDDQQAEDDQLTGELMDPTEITSDPMIPTLVSVECVLHGSPGNLCVTLSFVSEQMPPPLLIQAPVRPQRTRLVSSWPTSPMSQLLGPSGVPQQQGLTCSSHKFQQQFRNYTSQSCYCTA